VVVFAADVTNRRLQMKSQLCANVSLTHYLESSMTACGEKWTTR